MLECRTKIPEMSPQEDSIVDFENPSIKEVVPVRTAADTSRYQVGPNNYWVNINSFIYTVNSELPATSGQTAFTEDGAEENFFLYVWIGCNWSRSALHPQGGDCGQVSEHSRLSDVLLSGWRRRWFQDGHLHSF